MGTKKEQVLNMVPAPEQEKISRGLLAWLNQYPEKPVKTINFEYLPPDGEGMSMETIQGAYKTKEYLRGGYLAQYQFRLLYRFQTGPGASNNNRLTGSETLNALADWAVLRARRRNDPPNLGTNRQARKIICNARAALVARYEDGSEDHQVLMTLEYEAI